MTLPVGLVALAFGIYVVLSVGFFTFMPAYVAAPGSAILLSAGAIALLVPIGNVLASLLVSGRDARFIALLSAAGFAVNAVLAIPAFGASSPIVATSALALFAIAGGMTASALFAGIPFIVRRGRLGLGGDRPRRAGRRHRHAVRPAARRLRHRDLRLCRLRLVSGGIAIVGIVCLVPLTLARVLRDTPPQTPR